MHDLRDAWRALRATPIVSGVAILSLALGIGANTAIFSILDSLLLKPLPVREPHRLVLVGSDDPYGDASHSYAIWTEIRDRRLFDRPFAWATDRVSLASTGEADFAEAIWATGNFFDVLGVPAILGRTFGERDDSRSGGPDGAVAVISYRLWQARFGGAPGAVKGRTSAGPQPRLYDHPRGRDVARAGHKPSHRQIRADRVAGQRENSLIGRSASL